MMLRSSIYVFILLAAVSLECLAEIGSLVRNPGLPGSFGFFGSEGNFSTPLGAFYMRFLGDTNIMNVSHHGSNMFVYPGAINAGFWKGVNSWEPHTFTTFSALVDAETYVIDFGAWIGPTALFLASRAKKVVALEPDPAAFIELQLNAAVNGFFGGRLFVENSCVSHVQQRLALSSRFGNSVSSFVHFKENLDSAWGPIAGLFDTECTTLDSIVFRHSFGSKIFVKIDIEGFETLLLPNLVSFVNAYSPTCYVAFHPQLVDFSAALIHRLRKFVLLFPYVYEAGNLGDNKRNDSGLEFKGEIVLSFREYK